MAVSGVKGGAITVCDDIFGSSVRAGLTPTLPAVLLNRGRSLKRRYLLCVEAVNAGCDFVQRILHRKMAGS